MECYDIFIQAGQSNAEGTGYGPVTIEYVPDERILYLNAVKTVSEKNERVHVEYENAPFVIEMADERDMVINDVQRRVGDFALTFAKSYIDAGLLEQGGKVLIIRAAVGGTGFQKKHWGIEDDQYLKMLELTDYALSLNPENRLKGLLWHQGEHDAFEGNTPENYRNQLKTLINNVKARYNCPDLPFVCGDFVYDWKAQNLAICEPILQVIREVAREQGGKFVETGDLATNNDVTGSGDNIHFCRESLHSLGRRYFEAYYACGRAPKPEASGKQ